MQSGGIKLKYDGEITISTGMSVASRQWRNTETTWGWLVNRLSEATRTKETYKEFIHASKEEQLRAKDVGGFVGGCLRGGKREKANVAYRQLVTLDIDFSHPDFWWDFSIAYGNAAVLHTTHKSCPEKPRHRLIMPLSRKVTQEEYQAIARRIAASLNIELFDQSTFDVNRLMFWPSVSADMEYGFEYQDGEFLDADSVLATYDDWHDMRQWPAATDSVDMIRKEAGKQEDPLTKGGLIGAFCRTYTIEEAIEAFLPLVYEKVGENRYTYMQGSTAGGMIVYENKFAYSHHGTDPASGQLCNAFDLVRIHKFGHLDTDGAKRIENRESFKAMENFAAKDPNVRKTHAREKLVEAQSEFSELENVAADTEWTKGLTMRKDGGFENSANNINLILQNDDNLKNAFKLNLFDNKRYVTKNLPWREIDGIDTVKDVDYSGLRSYIECVYGIVSNSKVDDAFALVVEKNKFHPVRDYIRDQVWDGTPRVDTLLIDYFGAIDNAYTRAVIRKTLAAAVARVFEPGIKYDNALILVGEQGTYKSSFVKKLGGKWFSDTFCTVQGKESFEQIQGVWLMEMAELSGLKKAEVESIKHYLSKSEDTYRPAYGRVVETYKRQCVFFGTTNNMDFLRDPSGNRRFLPVDVRHGFATKSVHDDLTEDEVGQIWAEAYIIYKKGETLYLTGEEADIAKSEQAAHSETDSRRGIIMDYLERIYPYNWQNIDIYERRHWLENPPAVVAGEKLQFVCIAQIWCECLYKDKSDLDRYKSREINEIMRTIPGWELGQNTHYFGAYGTQRYYKRKQ